MPDLPQPKSDFHYFFFRGGGGGVGFYDQLKSENSWKAPMLFMEGGG